VNDRDQPRWSAEDALRIKDQLCQWLRTSDGVKAIYLHMHSMYKGTWPPSITDPWRLAAATAEENADLFASDELIWCDPAMVDLLAAAADTYPDTPVRPQHLPSPHGIGRPGFALARGT